jgi:small subunit ribosomal protein S6
MPLYEHVFIARQDLSNAQAEGLIEHFSTVLADNGGKVVENEYWGVKTMAYKINKNRKGHYAFLKSDAPAAAVQEMERLMRLHDDVMRVLTIKVDKHAEGVSVQMQKRDDASATVTVATVVVSAANVVSARRSATVATVATARRSALRVVDLRKDT